MSWIDKIQEAIDYIEDNLFDDITIESLANTINYAPSSFQNLFSVNPSGVSCTNGISHKFNPIQVNCRIHGGFL